MTEQTFQKEMNRFKVLEMHRARQGYGAIANALGLSKATVQSIVLRFKDRNSVVDEARSGRPSKISAQYVFVAFLDVIGTMPYLCRFKRNLKMLASKDPFASSSSLARQLWEGHVK